jgi:alkylhydroperoxidase family enzyme
MKSFPIHTIDSAPEGSRASLAALQGAFGMIPNVAGAMATSPVLIGSLVGLFGKVHGGSFAENQIQVVLLTNAVANVSPWAVAFHSALALRHGVAAADVDAIRAGQLPKDSQLAALSALARSLIERRGHLSQQDADQFLEAGFGKSCLLEVIAIVAASTITNYTATVTNPPLEEAFTQHTWSSQSKG